ncbi:MAG: hypothetical protein JNJ90_18010 [Saprospiraceae bacterium]|nr:hypothetical protein [Saprospiraceae bacterium]
MTTTEQPDQLAPKSTLVEGRDYYLEKGYLVFTEYFLRQRGKCCGSGCRHCPYRKSKVRND